MEFLLKFERCRHSSFIARQIAMLSCTLPSTLSNALHLVALTQICLLLCVVSAPSIVVVLTLPRTTLFRCRCLVCTNFHRPHLTLTTLRQTLSARPYRQLGSILCGRQ